MTATTTHSAVVSFPADTQILITREFNAPRHLVFRAHVEPDLIKRWWAGERGQVDSVEVDLRVGGHWRYVMTANGGFEVAFHGEYREIVPNERIVNTEVFEGVPNGDDDPAIVTYTFTEHDGRTSLTVLTEVSSRQVRDMIIETGMEGGMQEAMDALEKVAISLA